MTTIEEFEEGNGGGASGAADAALIGLVGSAFDEGRGGHAKRDVLARGRRLRRRKRAMPAFGAAGIVAAATSLALAMSGPGGAAGTTVNVDNAAFSVHTDAATGDVTVTIRQVLDGNELKGILAKAGIRAVFGPETVHVAWGQMPPPPPCTWPGPKDVTGLGMFVDHGKGSVTIVRSKLPSGSVIAIQYYMFGKDITNTMAVLSGEPTGCR